MSEDLRDEVEALNSIYGEGCLIPSEDQDETPAPSSATYILQLPGDESSSLRLQFPASYPAEPPSVLGTQHSSGGRKGAGARDLGVFREALGTVFQPGSVCLFDAVEEFSRRIEEEKEQEELLRQQQEEDDDVEGEGRNADRGERTVDNNAGQVDFATMTPPPWTLSEVVVENKSTFVAHVARVTSPAEAKLFLQHLLWSDKRIRSATHNITAWRIRGAGGVSYNDCDDDGEDAAGGRLLHLLQLMEVWDAMVVVTRWYGGVKLGPRRFALINSVARDGLVRAGMGDGKEKEKRKGK